MKIERLKKEMKKIKLSNKQLLITINGLKISQLSRKIRENLMPITQRKRMKRVPLILTKLGSKSRMTSKVNGILMKLKERKIKMPQILKKEKMHGLTLTRKLRKNWHQKTNCRKKLLIGKI